MAPDQLKKEMRRLLWATCRQREKVSGILRPLLAELYPEDEIGELRKLIETEYLIRIGYAGIWGETQTNQRFTCPQCGGHRFGSSDFDGVITRHCNDEHGTGCTWEGPGSACGLED